MSNQLAKGDTFADGQTVNAARLNNLVDLGTALEGLISTPGAVDPIPSADYVLFLKIGTPNTLHKCKVEKLPSGVTSIAWDAGYPQPAVIFNGSVVAGTGDAKIRLSMAPQHENKFLAGPVAVGLSTPTFRTIAPTDLPIGTVAVAAQAVDWDLGNTFYKAISGANFVPTFSNTNPGQTIRIIVRQDIATARTVNWTGIPVRWPGGTDPVMSTALGAIDMYTISFVNGWYLGTFEQNFLP